MQNKPKYVLDADIAKCFDRINHQVLLSKLNTFPTIRRQIREELKAGVIDFSAYANRQKTYSKHIFNQADTTLFSQLKAWAEHRHPNKSGAGLLMGERMKPTTGQELIH